MIEALGGYTSRLTAHSVIICFVSSTGRALPLLDKLSYFKIMMKNSKEIGNLTELQCITGLYELGCDISIPFGNSQKYDLIMDWNNQLFKVQVKHSSKDNENTYFSFKTRWQGHNSSGYTQTSYTKDDIDFFATYFDGNVYLIPVEQCSGAEKRLRLKPTKNGQIKGVNFAKDYLAKEVLKKI